MEFQTEHYFLVSLNFMTIICVTIVEALSNYSESM